jgi:serine/threonine protein kinase
VTWLSDAALDRLREPGDGPDLSGTRYELIGVLGRGGMSTVSRARDRELDREVALKVMAPERAASVARLRTEARVLARLEHPGLVPVHDVGTLPDGRLFYVMRLVRGSGSTSTRARSARFRRCCACSSASARPWRSRTPRACSTATSSPPT